jgi:hypothetical protein
MSGVLLMLSPVVVNHGLLLVVSKCRGLNEMGINSSFSQNSTMGRVWLVHWRASVLTGQRTTGVPGVRGHTPEYFLLHKRVNVEVLVNDKINDVPSDAMARYKRGKSFRVCSWVFLETAFPFSLIRRSMRSPWFGRRGFSKMHTNETFLGLVLSPVST